MLGHDISEFYTPGSPAATLAAAAAAGDSGRVAELARTGANPNAPGRDGMLPLSWALMAKSEPGVRALLAAGADPNRRTGPGQPSPISLVAGAAETRWLALLLVHGGSTNALTREDEPIIFQVIGARRLDAVRLLAEHGADLNSRGVSGVTPLIQAAILRQYPIVRYLLERGADWRLARPTGATLAYYVDDQPVDPEFREAYEAQRWTRAFLEGQGVRFPVPKPWEQRPAGGVAGGSRAVFARRYGYDAADQLVRLADGARGERTYEYDACETRASGC